MQKTSIRFSSQQLNIAFLLSDRNIKMGCYAIFFLQRLNLVVKGYIILDRTLSFHGILGDSPENLRKHSVYEKFYHPRN